jgi:hypothetical protein
MLMRIGFRLAAEEAAGADNAGEGGSNNQQRANDPDAHALARRGRLPNGMAFPSADTNHNVFTTAKTDKVATM